MCTEFRPLPTSLTSQLIVGVWCLISVVLTAAYTGALTSIIAVPTFKIPIDSLEDLLKSDMPFVTEAGSAFMQILKVGPCL